MSHSDTDLQAVRHRADVQHDVALVTVPAAELVLVVAIAGGGGTITSSRLCLAASGSPM